MNKFSNNIRIPHHFESSYIISICVLYTVSVPLFDGLARVLNIIILIAGLNSSWLPVWIPISILRDLYLNTSITIFEIMTPGILLLIKKYRSLPTCTKLLYTRNLSFLGIPSLSFQCRTVLESITFPIMPIKLSHTYVAELSKQSSPS